MNTFLNIVAKDILKKYADCLSEITIVFPNKRAALFLNEELIRLSGNNVIWSPQYTTISDLFRSQSDLVTGDQIKLICELYRHYSYITGPAESLDDFYGWGELMLSDFDDLDKNMGNDEQIFRNTSELHEFDNATYVTPEQFDTLRKFFKNISDNPDSELKQNFIKLWNNLGNIYHEFRKSLRSQGIAYEGMLYRDVIENLDTKSNFPSKKYLFVGFNLVQKVEQELFHELKKNGKAAFYWDFDKYYISDNNEAGVFIKKYLEIFPNEIDDTKAYDNFTHNKDITYASASSEDIQARYITQWLTKERIEAGKRTAIVMADEKMLPTIINCLPESVKEVNITTGYPLAQTHIATLVKLIFMLKNTGATRNRNNLRLHKVNQVLHHPYIKFYSENTEELYKRINESNNFYPTPEELSIDEHLARLFALPTPEEEKDNQSKCLYILNTILNLTKRIAQQSARTEEAEGAKARDTQLMQESVYRMHQIVTRLATLISSNELCIDVITLQSLLNQIIRSTNVPFHGEPIIGIQIMGVLETRNLDFDHLLILSANEGNLPKATNDVSFIPHIIRKAYGLTTIENKVAIYAYYFHRMLQRASDITLTYNNASNETQACEMSRFMMQLLAESQLNINRKALTTELVVGRTERVSIDKKAEVIKKMEEKMRISPSAINDYMRCPLLYFYKGVCNIKDNADSDEEILDKRVFGNIFHKAAELIYKPYEGKNITESIIDGMLRDKSFIPTITDRAIKEELFKIKDDKRKIPQLSGVQLISRNIVMKLLTSLLQYDKECCPFTIIATEARIYDTITISTDNGIKELKVNGIIDRLDKLTIDGKEVIRVVDYKTGNSEAKASSVNGIFNPKEEKGNSKTEYYLQTMLYSKILVDPEKKENMFYFPDKPVVPALLYPHRWTPKSNYTPVLSMGKESITDIRDYKDEFYTSLKTVLEEIYNYQLPFTPAKDSKECDHCYFSNICGKHI